MDSHKVTIHVAVITGTGRPVDDREFPTTGEGYRRAVAWLAGHGPLQAVGVEGTSSYGIGICTALTTTGFAVVEVNRTRPTEGRRRGKTDPLDAYRAARSVLSGEASTDPKRATIEPLRALSVARQSAVKAQHAAWRQIGALLVNAPSHHLRDRLSSLSTTALLAALAGARPAQVRNADEADILLALRALARRHRDLAEEITMLEERLKARPSRKPRTHGRQGRRPGRRRTAADHRQRQPRPAPVLSVLRRPLRHRTHLRQLWTHRHLPGGVHVHDQRLLGVGAVVRGVLAGQATPSPGR